MACQMDIIALQPKSLVVNERYERCGVLFKHFVGSQNFTYAQNLSRQTTKLDVTSDRKRYTYIFTK